MNRKPNKLINEKSPYLLQHAYNPVDWFPWCEEAFEKAKREDKPIFLSIGYSTCHWCHVMERESFEDEEVAKLMNDTFISIKVDREERPDIDGVYMAVCQMITGGGGWPLTIVMTPDKKPFFAGTYFPKYNRFGRIGMLELITKLNDIWKNRREEVLNSAEEITKSINKISHKKSDEEIDEKILDKAFDEYSRRFDKEYGGFGNAPKFPTPHNLLFLLRYYRRTKNLSALKIVEKTLTEMRKGGIYDQIGFGFARYSTDKYWLVPHFEKMLYDNALLLMAFSEAFQITGNDFYKTTSEEIAEYVLRDMTHPEGGFFSAEDADSEGEEGKFYLWTEVEIRELLTKDEADFIIKVFNIEPNGNWYDEARGVRTGNNILHLKKSYKELANDLSMSENDFIKNLSSIRKKMFDWRKKRVHPHKDDKILTDWNSLMISALIKSSVILDKNKFLQAAMKADKFVKKYLFRSEKLLHRFRESESAIDGNIDDYAFFIQAQLDLFEATSEAEFLLTAIRLNEILFHKFWDDKSGGYFFTSEDSEKLIVRQKEIYDGAIPSGNSVQLLNLLRLYELTGNAVYYEIAQKQVKAFASEVSRMPSVFAQFLCGFDFLSGASVQLVITAKDKNVADEIFKKLSREYFPSKVIIRIDNSNCQKLSEIIPHLKDYKVEEKPTIYFCRDFVCEKPTNNVDEVIQRITEL
ncbi:Thioredoxin domain protein [Ignavibacterium album JCM 16511]|uniref:Thioredoxin domain protein n=1 Tax=Ignavibacterium album (strain DSM 19864 / JCM 16511 / NBRC 101810 / Mat9-16) TaxID=945713 RepID=I0ANY0_IGNAJ|nr:thioredoxin domain-containing protein [Ignavibacterium album]AFH50687.1 Thioredoxin domain protein [Ignavibacterium album JCM 16511]